MYEDAFEMGEKSFDDQFKKRPKKLKPNGDIDDGKVPSLLKSEENRSGRSGKLQPIDDKLKNSRVQEKQSFIQSQSGGNVRIIIFRWNGSTT